MKLITHRSANSRSTAQFSCPTHMNATFWLKRYDLNATKKPMTVGLRRNFHRLIVMILQTHNS